MTQAADKAEDKEIKPLDGDYTVPEAIENLRKACDTTLPPGDHFREFVLIMAATFEKAYASEHHCQKLPGNGGKGLAPRCKRLDHKVEALTMKLTKEQHEHQITKTQLDEAVVVIEHMVSVIRGLQHGDKMTSIVKNAIEEAEAFNQKMAERE